MSWNDRSYEPLPSSALWHILGYDSSVFVNMTLFFFEAISTEYACGGGARTGRLGGAILYEMRDPRGLPRQLRGPCSPLTLVVSNSRDDIEQAPQRTPRQSTRGVFGAAPQGPAPVGGLRLRSQSNWPDKQLSTYAVEAFLAASRAETHRSGSGGTFFLVPRF